MQSRRLDSTAFQTLPNASAANDADRPSSDSSRTQGRDVGAFVRCDELNNLKHDQATRGHLLAQPFRRRGRATRAAQFSSCEMQHREPSLSPPRAGRSGGRPATTYSQYCTPQTLRNISSAHTVLRLLVHGKENRSSQRLRIGISHCVF